MLMSIELYVDPQLIPNANKEIQHTHQSKTTINFNLIILQIHYRLPLTELIYSSQHSARECLIFWSFIPNKN